ncbi:SRPBCC family protein [Sphingomonas sp.]|uniref:SRPBCC family protein n=1 Tax=Sphingomonas sp. TaxID=28214 RepID=UPI0025E18B6F|nr:SRPBCC family protein [Sphingomonas sp.]
MFRTAIAAALLSYVVAPAAADVVKTEAAGFVVEKTVTIDAAPDAVWETLRAPQRWWSKEHTWSGDSANLYIDSQATGCFCEKLPGRGSVQHARLVFVDKGKLLRMEGAFGPLQGEAIVATLTFELSPEGDKATKVKMTYVAGGYSPTGFDKLAPAVDSVMSAQLDGLKAAAEGPPPAPLAPSSDR